MEAAPPSWFHWIVVVLGLVLPVFPVFLEVVICVVILINCRLEKDQVALLPLWLLSSFDSAHI